MKVSNGFGLVAAFLGSGLAAMDDKPISVQDYQQALASNDCKRIVDATKTLWPKARMGVHIHWSGNDMQITGEHRTVMRVGGFMPTEHTFNDSDYRKLLHHWFVTQFLHSAMFGTEDIAHVFAKIDALSNNFDGIFGNDKRGYTQLTIKHAILANRFPDDYDAKVWGWKLTPLAQVVEVPGIRKSMDDLVVYVGRHMGEQNIFTGKLPLKIKLYHNRRLIGLIGIAAVVCLGCSAVYKKYCVTDDKKDGNEVDEAEEEQEENQNGKNDEVIS